MRSDVTAPAALAPAMTAEAFARLGGSRLAYVRAARSEDVAFICPNAPPLAADSGSSCCTPPTARLFL